MSFLGTLAVLKTPIKMLYYNCVHENWRLAEYIFMKWMLENFIKTCTAISVLAETEQE